MADPMTILVATAGQGILRSKDDGRSWLRLDIDQDIDFDGVVRCLAPHPIEPRTVFAGTERGLCRSDDAGETWKRIDSALNDYSIWSLAFDDRDPNLIYAGTGSPSRARVFRSRDGGHSWELLPLEMPERCAGVGRPRFTAVAIDPLERRAIWAGVEESGLFRSRDGGENWERVDGRGDGIANSDIHSIVILPGSPKTVVVVVVNAIYTSTDDGNTWAGLNAKDAFGLRYSRVLAPVAGSACELILGIGDGTPGTTSAVLRSRDAGRTWQILPLPVQPNSCFWAIGTNRANPKRIFMGTKYGDLFRTENGGDSWRKEWREFSEITDLLWVPAV